MIKINSFVKEDLDAIASNDYPWGELLNKSILVTGAGGFIGSFLVKSLLYASTNRSLNLKVYSLGRSKLQDYERLSNFLSHPGFYFIQHDISSDEPKSFPDFDIIIHAASQASPKYYGIDPVGTLLPNIVGTQKLLNLARCQKKCKFVFISSGSVYGDHNGLISEFGEQDYGWLDPVNVRSCYAESKRMAETMCVSWSHQFGIESRIVRLFHTYGPTIALDDGRVFSDFIADAVNHRPIMIKSDGQSTRSFCYIKDTIEGILTVLFYGQSSHAYNVGNPKESISVYDLAHLIRNLFPDRIPYVKFKQDDRGNSYIPSPVKNTAPSIAKLISLGWSPSTTIREGFCRSISSFDS